jgi:3-isopropylmalate/(R)-2-methylmalate dehydratase small subunit
MNRFSGKVLFLDRSDINTDEIIPAKYLTEISKEALKPYLLEDLKLPGFDREKDLADAGAIITRSNFGCGSSREHAPWALEVNGIRMVIGESFARIFRQNMFNCGMLAIELPSEAIEAIFSGYAGKETYIEADLDAGVLRLSAGENKSEIGFSISGFDKSLVKAGGWLEFADENY